jgi:hypothetical protein
MAQQTLNPWLADLITEEIGAICTWQANKHAGIKVCFREKDYSISPTSCGL